MTKKSTNNRGNVGADARTTARGYATAVIARYCGGCVAELDASARPLTVGGTCERCDQPANPLFAVSAMPRAAELAGDRLIAGALVLVALPNPSRGTVATALAMTKTALELDEGLRG